MELKQGVFHSLRPHGGRLVLPDGGESFLPPASERMSLLDAVKTLHRGTRHEKQIIIIIMVFGETDV